MMNIDIKPHDIIIMDKDSKLVTYVVLDTTVPINNPEVMILYLANTNYNRDRCELLIDDNFQSSDYKIIKNRYMLPVSMVLDDDIITDPASILEITGKYEPGPISVLSKFAGDIGYTSIPLMKCYGYCIINEIMYGVLYDRKAVGSNKLSICPIIMRVDRRDKDNPESKLIAVNDPKTEDEFYKIDMEINFYLNEELASNTNPLQIASNIITDTKFIAF